MSFRSIRTSSTRVAACALLGASATARSDTTLISATPTGAAGAFASMHVALSENGRSIVFASYADDLVAGDANGKRDIFVRDQPSPALLLLSLSSAGAAANADAQFPQISGNGSVVTFQSFASNLVANDLNNYEDVFVRDRVTGTTACASVDPSGNPGAGGTAMLVPFEPASSLSRDGRWIAFQSPYTNLVVNDNNAAPDIFVRDRSAGLTVRVSVDALGTEGNGGSRWPSLSADGRFVAFQSHASNLTPGDTNGRRDVFVRDLASGSIELVSLSSTGVQADQDSERPSLSADGRCIAFHSLATTLVALDFNADFDVFVRDRAAGTLVRASVDDNGVEGDEGSYDCELSNDGRTVAFWSRATNLIATDFNQRSDVFVRDLLAGTTVRASVNASDGEIGSNSFAPALSGDGRFAAFQTYASLVAGDQNGDQDLYLRDLAGATATSYCTPELNSAGCAPRIAFAGMPSASSGASFTISATLVLNQKAGLLFYGPFSAALPYQGGTLCVAQPMRRTALLQSGGSGLPAADCSGAYALDFNARIQAGVDPSLVAGAVVHAQFWYRDGAQPPGAQNGFTDAGFFEIGP